MGLFNLKQKNTSNSLDVLEVYPEKVQVHAIPERRYLRTSRLLAVIIIINLAMLIAVGGIYVYIANRVDVSIATSRLVNLLAMDVEQKVIKPAEHGQGRANALQLMIEDIVKTYINQRHSIVWDNDVMANRVGLTGYVAAYSSQRVFEGFQQEITPQIQASRTNGFVRDVHLYELRLVGPDLWQGIFDTFDMPVPDSFNPLCGACNDNSESCLTCKRENAYDHKRYKVYAKTNFAGTKALVNPVGILVYSYSLLYMPIHPEEKFWDIPAALRPEL